MNLGDVLSERSQAQMIEHGMIPLLWGTWSGQIHIDRECNGGGQGLGAGREGVASRTYFCKMKRVLVGQSSGSVA